MLFLSASRFTIQTEFFLLQTSLAKDITLNGLTRKLRHYLISFTQATISHGDIVYDVLILSLLHRGKSLTKLVSTFALWIQASFIDHSKFSFSVQRCISHFSRNKIGRLSLILWWIFPLIKIINNSGKLNTNLLSITHLHIDVGGFELSYCLVISRGIRKQSKVDKLLRHIWFLVGNRVDSRDCSRWERLLRIIELIGEWRTVTVHGDAAQITMMLFGYLKNRFNLWRLLGIGVINLGWVQPFHLFLGYESTLMAVPLFCQVLSTSISDFLLIAASLLFYQIPVNFLQLSFIYGTLHESHRCCWRLANHTNVWLNLFRVSWLVNLIFLLV